MDELHKHLAEPKPPLANIVLHDGVAARKAVLVPETVEDTLRRVPLLAVVGPIVLQDPINDPRLECDGGPDLLGTRHEI